MAWDASFKNILKYFFSQLSPVSASIEVITETDVPTANLRIDFLIKHQQSLTYPFNYCRNEIIGEFKSDRDVFNLDELHRSIAKSYLHATSTDLNVITLCYIIGGMVNLPSSIIEMYNTDKISDGIHRLDHSLDIIIILLDNLRYTPAIQFLGLFAGASVRQQTIRFGLLEDNSFITSVAYFLYEQEVQVVAQSENIELDPKSISIKSAVEAIGLNRVIDEVGLSRVIDEVGLSKVIDEVGLSKVIDEVGLERVFNQLTEKQKSELRELLDRK